MDGELVVAVNIATGAGTADVGETVATATTGAATATGDIEGEPVVVTVTTGATDGEFVANVGDTVMTGTMIAVVGLEVAIVDSKGAAVVGLVVVAAVAVVDADASESSVVVIPLFSSGRPKKNSDRQQPR